MADCMGSSVLITIDTELNAALHGEGVPCSTNLAIAVNGRCDRGEYGVAYKLERFAEFGIEAVFFVDPMPGLIYGSQIVADIVGPILEHGQEVQLHLHSEWLEFLTEGEFAGLSARNMGDLPLADQKRLLARGRQMLMDAGAPEPNAFRAGNYGANDDTLQALGELGFHYDSSYNAAYAGGDCRITADHQTRSFVRHGITEVPISGLFDRPDQIRPAQICALSLREMKEAMAGAEAEEAGFFNIVSHSFELISRRTGRLNKTVRNRFDGLCRHIAESPGLQTCGFHSLQLSAGDGPTPIEPDMMRTMARIGEQAMSHLAHGIIPAPAPAAASSDQATRATGAH